VATLLETARAAHARYRNAAGRIDTKGKVSQIPNLRACGAAVQEALSARVDASRLDPLEEDMAWIEDRQAMRGETNHDLISFYAKYLSFYTHYVGRSA
jgi:hypothetical protein